MLRPVFSFFNGCEGLGEVWADACPAARPAPREVRDKRERQRKGRTAETGTANPLISSGFASS